MNKFCKICLKDDRFDPVTNLCSRCSDKKIKATIFSFITGFCLLIGGAICARIYVAFTAQLMIEECMMKSPNDASCYAAADALLIKALAVGLSMGATLGIVSGIVIYRNISKTD